MVAPLCVGLKLLPTLVTLVLVTSWKVDALHMPPRLTLPSAYLPTHVALKLSNVFPFSDFARVSMQVLFNSFSIFPTVLHASILNQQCSQVQHKKKIKWRICGIYFDFHTVCSGKQI